MIDTSFFTGNYPPEAAVDGLTEAGWEPLVPRSPLKGDAENAFAVTSPRRVTHVRLRILPDGGVARLRVYGEALPEPALLDALATLDLVAMEHGGRVLGCSDRFYGAPNNLLLPGPARSMGEGWETARRRDGGHDWVDVALVAEGAIRVVEIDTSYFLHNAPGAASIDGVLPRTALEPDTRHRFVLAEPVPARTVRLDIHPDGGLARLRLHGSLTAAGRAALGRRYADSTGAIP